MAWFELYTSPNTRFEPSFTPPTLSRSMSALICLKCMLTSHDVLTLIMLGMQNVYLRSPICHFPELFGRHGVYGDVHWRYGGVSDEWGKRCWSSFLCFFLSLLAASSPNAMLTIAFVLGWRFALTSYFFAVLTTFCSSSSRVYLVALWLCVFREFRI